MRFPKPIVYLGFFLILAAVGAGIYDSFFKSSSQVENKEDSAKRLVAEKIIDGLFEQLKKSLEEDSIEVKEAGFLELKKVHKKNYVSKYLFLAQELERNKHSVEESIKANENFTASAMNQLKSVYLRKYSKEKASKEE
ncbi:MAG: hypothetical protein NE328_05220 [Lentisphaeraceae bacterium]|nr:hypothetical protein [Lentisphaeraceae bacterium]